MSSKVHLFFRYYRTERSDVPAGPVNQLPIHVWCPPFDPRKPYLVYKFWYVVYTHSMFEHKCSLTWIHFLSYYTYCLRQYLFIRPSSDGTYYGMVMNVHLGLRPSVRFSVRPSVRLTLRPPVFPTFLIHAYWHIELKFCTWICFNVLQIKFECRHFASTFEGVMPLCELRI